MPLEARDTCESPWWKFDEGHPKDVYDSHDDWESTENSPESLPPSPGAGVPPWKTESEKKWRRDCKPLQLGLSLEMRSVSTNLRTDTEHPQWPPGLW